jgi:hypothetical protein
LPETVNVGFAIPTGFFYCSSGSATEEEIEVIFTLGASGVDF